MMKFLTEMRHVLMALLIMVTTVACSKGSGPTDEKATAQISGYNHTAEYIHQFYVDEAWGGNAYAYSGGGSFVCCLIYPMQWRDGLKAKVRWTTSSSDPKATGADAEEMWHEATVPIEHYSKPGTTLNVHFLPNAQVRLIISNGNDKAPGYPGPRLPAKPKDFKW